MVDEWDGEFGGERPASVANLMDEVLNQQMARRLSANQRAAAAWFRANGDRERNHTVGVFLKKARVAGAAPVLGVYVDSHAMATDFGVNRDIYLARLANIGFEASGLEFIVSRQPRRRADEAGSKKSSDAAREDLPELGPVEREEVESLVRDLPEAVRPAAARAISIAKRREKQEKQKNG